MPGVADLTRARGIALGIGIAITMAGGGCGGEERTRSPAASHLERAIEAELGARFGARVRARCPPGGPSCTARLPDGTELPIELTRLADEWQWSVQGLVIATDDLARHLELVVADLGAPQAVRCAPRVQRIAPGDRITCELEHGGAAFVTVAADGATAFEVVLDAEAAAARAEEVTPERERALAATSEALAPRAEDANDEAAGGDGANADGADDDEAAPAPVEPTDPR